MKFKHVITTFALAGLLGAGALVGAKVTQSKEVRAAQGDVLSGYTIIGSAVGHGWTDQESPDYQFVEQADGSYTWEGNFSVERFRISKGDNNWTTLLDWNNVDTNSAKVKDGTFVKASTITTDNDNNIWCKVAGKYILRISSDKTKLAIEAPAGKTYTVSYDENGDGTIEQSETVSENETIVGYTPYKFGNNFDYWTLNDAEFNPATPITSDITLTAHWSERTDEKGYVYVITGYGADWATRYIYGFGASEGYGTWKGQLVTDIAEGVTQTLNFGGSNDQYLNGGLFKVPYYVADGMTDIILHNNGSDDDRSGNLPLGENYAYSFKNNPWDTEGDKFDAATMASIGKAARFAFVFDKLLSGKDFCTALDSVQCAATYNAYLEAIDGDDIAKGWIESSCINTSNGGDNVNLKTILEELRKIAVRDGQTVNDSNSMNVVDQNNAILVAVIIVASIVSLSTLFLLIKRRKEFNK